MTEQNTNHNIETRMPSKTRSVVIGGSIAGMLTARVLAHHFEEVVVVEADRPPGGPTARKRVPQGHHSHLLLQRGQRILDEMFPGFSDELAQNGSIVTDFTDDLEWFHFGKRKPRFKSGLRFIQQTRPFLEWHVYKRMVQIPNVTFRYNTHVVGLTLTSDKQQVTGVSIASGETSVDAPNGSSVIQAELVVDASGHHSPSLKWLEMEKAVPVETLDIDLFYASRTYKHPAASELGWKNVMVSPDLPQQRHFGVILAYEDEQFGVTVGGYRTEPPKTVEAFEALARSLSEPTLHQFIKSATPVSDLKVFRIPAQVRKRMDKVKHMPRRFLLAGDAYCRFDPLYGQGMSMAAAAAESLGQLLHQPRCNLDILHVQYYESLFKITKDPWDMVATETYRDTELRARRPFGSGLKKWLTKKIYTSSAKDQEVYMLLAQVMNLTQPPSRFFQPAMLMRILK